MEINLFGKVRSLALLLSLVELSIRSSIGWFPIILKGSGPKIQVSLLLGKNAGSYMQVLGVDNQEIRTCSKKLSKPCLL